jgi:anti-sigma factor RsiW
MSEKHYQEKLSEFVNHELPNDERQTIAEHLLQCVFCRKQHDEIKLGAALATHLRRADVPEGVWKEIEKALDGEEKRQGFRVPQFSFVGSRAFVAAALLIGFGLIAAVYFGLAGNESQEIAKNETTIQGSNIEIPQTVSTPNEIISNQNRNTEILPDIHQSHK